MTARQEIAAAASTVEGVNVSPTYRQDTKPGSGTVRRDRTDYGPGPTAFGGSVSWQVIVVLPSDLAQAEAKAEALEPLLVAALDRVGVVRSAVPSTVTFTDAGKVPALVLTLTRETE